ncbi:MAG: hypothetical protein ACRC0L_08820, partial [Angustibacter sp.]
MINLIRSPDKVVATVAVVSGLAVVIVGVAQSAVALPAVLRIHAVTVVVVVMLIALGELARIRMPSGRETAPLSSASAMAVVFLGPVAAQPVFDIEAGLAVLIVTAGLLIAAVVRRARHHAARAPMLAARIVGVALAATLTRELGDPTLWEAKADGLLPKGVVAFGMALVAAVG